MTTENVRIAVRDAQDSQTLAFMDNSAPNAIHFDQADLTRFYEGDSTVLQMRFNKKHDRANAIREGSKLAFIYKGKDYWLNIITAKDVSHQRELMAFSLSLELNKEKVGFYAANTAMAFVEYLKSIDFEQTLTIGINEIADKKLKLDWDGDQSKLGRLYSLANKFDAEISFETILNDDYSLKQQIINIYKKHDESNQGIGQDKTATTLRVGKDLKVINRSASLENFYSAIRGTGKDGISINDIEFEELDANGNVLYFSKKGQDVIWAPQARDAFPSKNNPGNDGYLVEKKGETEYTTVEALKGYLLSELKKNSSVYVDYETEGHFDSDPGDTFSLEDSVYYSPPLYLEARVYEQTESLVLGDFSSDKTTFSNFVEKTSEIDSSLLARVQALIEANKVFTYEIITSDGVTFKNGFGSTTLTARVRDGIKDVTDTFSLKWYKDGTFFSNTKTVTINAADIEEKAVFRFEVADDSGNVRGGAEVTVTNVDDGKEGEPGETYYPYRGYLMADGTFTKVYPSENLLTNSELKEGLDGWAVGTGVVATYSPEYITLKKAAVQSSRGTFNHSLDVAGFKPNTAYSISMEVYVESASGANTGRTNIFFRSNNGTTYKDDPAVDIDLTKVGQWQTITATGTSLGGALTTVQFTLAISQDVIATIRVRRPKLSEGNSALPYTPKPSENYENAYPKWEGFYSSTDDIASDNPDDYRPWTPFMGPQGGQGPKGDSAPLISLSGATQAITVDKDGKITPASSFAVNGTAVNTAISNWTYSLNGGNFGSAVPTGVTRSGNTVTIDPTKAVFDTLTIKAADATVSDVFTISRIKDGGEGPPGADAYTVFLTNESYTFAGSTTAALAGSTTTEVIVYKGINKITPTSITVGTKPAGLSSSVSGSIITLTATTALVSKSGTVPITITADGKTFTKQFSYALSLQGPQGPAGEDGKDGSDGKDGANGQDAKEVISGYLSNDSIIVPANASGTVTDFTKALGDFIIYEGQTKVSSSVTYSKVSEIGMTSTINSAGRYTVTALSADVGTVTYQAVYKAVTIQKIMIVVKNKQGATGPAGTNGTDGKGIVSSATTYQAGTSGTTPPTGTWSTSIPSVSDNQYLWTRIVLTYSDNTNSTAYSVGKMGAKGETGATGSTGATGNGIKSTTINFASSTSGTTAPSSGWATSIPTVAAGSFLWTRTVLTFTDNTTNTSYTVAKQGEKGDPTGIISQATVPTNPYVGMLWQNTGASGYIIGATYQWNGSKFNLYIFTADNIVATTLSAITANLGTITAGTINGVTINGSEFINPYTRSYNDGTFAQGTQRIGSAELYNSGVIKNSQGVATQSYEAIFSHQLVSMTRYSGDSLGDQNELIAAMGLTFDSLTLNNQQTGFAGTLTAEMLYDTGWLKVTRLKGTAGDIYLKRYMNRILIRFDQFVWNGSANGASTSNAVAILPDKVREGFPQMFTVPVWIEGNATEKFQVENGRLYKLSNNSGNSRITAVGEVYI